MIYKPSKKDYEDGSLGSHKKLIHFIENADRDDILIIRSPSDAKLSPSGWLDLIDILEYKSVDLLLSRYKLSLDKTYFEGFKMACYGFSDLNMSSKERKIYKHKKLMWEENIDLVRKRRYQGLSARQIATNLNIEISTVFKCIEHIRVENKK